MGVLGVIGFGPGVRLKVFRTSGGLQAFSRSRHESVCSLAKVLAFQNPGEVPFGIRACPRNMVSAASCWY